MIWYFIDSLVTLPLLYAIMATIIEFRFSRRRCILVIALAVCASLSLDGLHYLYNGGDLARLYDYAWLTTALPSFICLLYLARFRDGSFLFAFLTECMIATITTFLSHIFAYFSPWQSGFFPFLIHGAMLTGIFFLCRRFLGKNFMEASRYQGKRWFLYCALPFLCITVWIMYTVLSQYNFNDEIKINFPYAGYVSPHQIPIFISVLIIVFYTVFLILLIISLTYRSETDRKEKTILYFQSNALEERLFSLEDKNQSLRILRHDMRHHLSTIAGLLDQKKLLQAKQYIRQLDHNLLQIKQECFCENPVINAIISYHAGKIQKEGLRFSAQVRISAHLPVDDMDIGAVLANALENAENACKNQPDDADPFISLSFIQHNRQFVLDISNSFSGVVTFDTDGRPVSREKNHGIGSQSIYAFVRKYHGTIDYDVDNGVFDMRIMFADNE